ncbi:MAG: sorbosone dehydrogenase family protein [Gemmataceae bacterium]
MRRALLLAGLVGIAVWFLSTSAADDAPKKTKRAAFGIDKRVPWTTSRVKGTPEPPPPYRSEPAFPKLKFDEPLELTAAPGSDRLFVAQRRGKLYSFKNDPAVARPDLLLDVKKTVYGLAFHPRFAENGYFYVTYIVDPGKDEDKGTRLVRFTADRKDPPTADLKSEKLILEWPSGGHNGGCLRFGPDGYLYIATGDGSGIADGRHTGQDLSDLLGALLRIDVDKQDGDKNYAIPPDNPFVKEKGARPENYAYGLRQPWKYSFDTRTGDLWAGEVGQDLWEMVYKIVKGGNYGWSIQEGAHPFRPERKKGPTPILAPIVEQPHSLFRSVTGGYVYHGKRLKELEGAYIYADYDTGTFWALRHDGKKVTFHEEIAVTPLRIVACGQDNQGEI